MSAPDGGRRAGKALILAGGRLLHGPRIAPLLQGAELVVAADSGLRHAARLGLAPTVVIGDFDSVSAAELARFPGVPRRRFPVAKDRLDLELAIDYALEHGARELVVLGAFGSRLDQSLACLLIASRLHADGLEITLHDGERDAYPLGAGDVLELELPPGTVFSLLALEEARCSVEGAEYRLEDEALPSGVGLGLANRATRGPRVEVGAGRLALIVEWLEGREIAGPE